jgi:hypothetical protein
MKVIIFVITLIIATAYGDISVTVNLKKSVNEISDKFISNGVNFNRLADFNQNLRDNKKNDIISPSYVKIENFSEIIENLEAFNDIKRQSEIKSIFDSL